MKINVDFRLLDVSLELYALKDHYELINNQLLHLKEAEEATLLEYLKRENLTPEDPEWDFARQECEHKVEFLLPRVFWGPYIVALYAAFETGVTEIASLLQKSQGQEIGINDLRGDFLERASKYYKNILRFELCSDNEAWQCIKMLAELRHAIAHVNGRLDMLNEKSRRKITAWGKQEIGITFFYNYLLFDSVITKNLLSQVQLTLESLIERYKELDTKTNSAEHLFNQEEAPA